MRVLVVDDEAPARDRLHQLLDDLEGFDYAGEAANGEQAIEFVAEHRPDIVLLDIRMPGIDGLETAHQMNALDEPPAVVFTTAYDEYAVDAFEARAVGYVLKPVRRTRLEAALENASRLAAATLSQVAEDTGLSDKRQHVCARAQGKLKLIPIDEVLYFQADQKYVAAHHEGGKSLIDDSLKSLEDEFGDRFVRIHRGTLVAVSRIESVVRSADGSTEATLRGASQDDDKALIISRRHVAEVRRRLKGG